MAKRTRLTDAEQQQLLDNFYESLDVEDEPNEFEEADVFMEENGEDVLAEELFENVDCVRGENVDDVAAEEEMSVVRKQRFNDLAEILDEGNFDDLPPQDKKEFIYQNKQMAKNNEKIAWSTVKNNDTVAGPSNEPAAPSPSRIPVLVRNSVEVESSPKCQQKASS